MKLQSIISSIPVVNRIDLHMQDVIKNASISLVLKILGAGLIFGFNVYLTRLLGTENAGIYFLALTIINICTVFGRMGLDNTLLRFVASNAAVGDWVAVKGVYKKGVTIALIASGITVCILIISTPWLANSLFSKPELIIPLRWMVLGVIPIVLTMLYAEMLRALQRIRDYQLLNGVITPAISFIGLYIIGSTYGVNGVAWIYVFASIFTALLGYVIWITVIHQIKGIKGQFDTRKLFNSCIPLFWVTSMNMVMNWTAPFLLGIWGTKADLGIFGAASRTALLTGFIIFAVNSIVASKFAALYKINDMEAIGSIARNSAKLMALLASPILLIFIFVPELVMGMFGQEFKQGGTLLTILAIGQFVNVATGSVGNLLIVCGHEQLLKNNVIFAAIICTVLNLILIPLIGALGAAIATAISLSVMNLISVYYVWSRLKIWTIPIFWRKNRV